MAPKFEQSAVRTGSGPNSPSRLAPDPDLINCIDPNEVRIGRQKNQNKYAPIGAYLELQSICIGKLSIIGSDNGMSPGRRQAIIWTNAGILLIETFSIKEMHLNMSSAKWRLLDLGLNELKPGTKSRMKM